MKAPTNLKRAAITLVFVAEVAAMAAVAYAAADLPQESVIVGEGEVVIEAVDQEGFAAFSVKRVVTPVDGWVVLLEDAGDGVPGPVIGAAEVYAGENRDVPVAVDPSRPLPPAAFVIVVADRGLRGEYEYITDDPEDDFVSLGGGAGGMSMGGAEEDDDIPEMDEPMDWPLVQDTELVTAHFRLTPFNVFYRLPEANIATAFLEGTGTEVVARGIDAPDEAWVVAIRVGDPTLNEDEEWENENEVIGAARVPAGHTAEVLVPVAEVTDGSEIGVMLVADLGVPDVLEIDPTLPARSVDAPYIVRSWFVWKRVAPPS